MRVLLRIAVVYFAAASVISALLTGDPGYAVSKIDNAVATALDRLGHVYIWPLLLAGLAVLAFTLRSGRAVAGRVANVLGMLAGCCIVMAAFTALKPVMPAAVQAAGLSPFFADPAFAALDRALFLGVDPWVAAHDLTRAMGWSEAARHLVFPYGVIWSVPAFYLPAIAVMAGEPEARVRHYVILYLFAWIVLGNFAALAGHSAGPVFYDRVFGGDRFAGLHAAMAAGGFEGSWFATVQHNLWRAHLGEVRMVGSGLSAFPSLHVATTMVTALYLASRHWVLGLAGYALLAVILFASVWTGYHYLIDGLASILAVWGVHRWLMARARRAGAVRDGETGGALVPGE